MKTKFDVVEVTNVALEKMRVDTNWNWDDWWEQIAGQEAPRDGSIKNFFYIQNRLELKDRINEELIKRGLPNRIFVIPRVGVYMVNEKRVTVKTIVAREKKMTACIDRSVNQYYTLSQAARMSSRNVALLDNKAQALEENKITLFTAPRELKLIPDSRNRLKEMETLDEMAWILENAHLDEREKTIYIHRVSEGLTLAEIGREVGLTRERIRQICAKIEQKIRRAVEKAKKL